MKFGEKLAQSKDTSWSQYYIDYDGLKDLLAPFSSPSSESIVNRSNSKSNNLKDHDDDGDNRTFTLPLSITTTTSGTKSVTFNDRDTVIKSDNTETDFVTALNVQVEKVVLFVIQEQGVIASRLAKCRRKHLQFNNESSFIGSNKDIEAYNDDDDGLDGHDIHDYNTLYDSYIDCAHDLLRLIRFMELNVTGLRKIIKKHDKQVKVFRRQQDKLMITYFGNNNKGSTGKKPVLAPLLSNHDDSMGALVAILQQGLVQVHVDIAEQQDQQRLLPQSSHQQLPPPPPLQLSTPPPPQEQQHRLPPLQSSSSSSHLPPLPPPPPKQQQPSQLPPQHPKSANRRHVRTHTAPASDFLFQQNQQQQRLGIGYIIPSSVKSVDRKTVNLNMLIGNNNSSNYLSSNKSYSSLLSGISAMPQRDYVLCQILAARKRLKQTSEFVQYLASPMMLAEGSDTLDEYGEDDQDGNEDNLDENIQLLSYHEDKEVASVLSKSDNIIILVNKQPTAISNLLNLLSTFFYMTNYYIVAPTSGEYAVELGGSLALSGLIIGMTPVAALVSTLLYSWWTSRSYKSALIFASACSCIGNLLYAAGLPCHSLTLVMVGRLCNGFGSARSINRRYIADAYARSDRTAASATFVTASALGMAAGPAIASILHATTQQASKGHVGNANMYWQSVNASGWVMAVVWACYLLSLVYFFEDPPRRPHVQPKKQVPEVEMKGETKPLLSSDGSKNNLSSNHVIKEDNEPSIWSNTPVLITFWLYFVLKLVLECALSSSSMLTGFYFRWSASISALYLAGLGLLMLPANLAVAHLATKYDDRQLIVAMTCVMLVGCVIIMKFTANYRLLQYLLGSVTIFLSTNALEGPCMSLLSKTIPRSWSLGFFNVGLLATEAGTLGRAFGDVFLTICGASGIQHLINSCFATMSGLSVASLFLMYMLYDHLEVFDKDD